MGAWTVLDLATVHLEGFVDRHAASYGFLNPVVGSRESRQHFQQLGHPCPRDDHDPVGRITEDQVTGVHHATIHVQWDLDRPRHASGTSTNRRASSRPDLQSISVSCQEREGPGCGHSSNPSPV